MLMSKLINANEKLLCVLQNVPYARSKRNCTKL